MKHWKTSRRRMLAGSIAVLLAGFWTGAAAGDPAGVTIQSPTAETYCIQNASLARVLSIRGGSLRTTTIRNKLAGKQAVPVTCSEFGLRISRGTHTTGTDVVLTSSDFAVRSSNQYVPNGNETARGISFLLENKQHELTVSVHYELDRDDFYLRKYRGRGHIHTRLDG